VDRERTDYVFRSPRRARERHVLWLPVDLAAKYGFYAGAILLVAGVILALIALTSKDKADGASLGTCVAAAVAGVIVLIIVNWLQRREHKPDPSGGVIRRKRK
jgi:hypothetical protein